MVERISLGVNEKKISLNSSYCPSRSSNHVTSDAFKQQSPSGRSLIIIRLPPAYKLEI
eukprot:jgi/Psemu1/35228/gm1.35228_g